MAINIEFDLSNNPEPSTIILAIRNGEKLGMLNAKEIEIGDKFNDVSEISFTLHKYIDGELTNLWDEVVDFKLVYCKEWDMWFEITVELDEETETVKTVFCKQLGQAELSQLNLYNIHINDKEDISRDDYKRTILFNEDDPEASLLHRLLKDKAPHYSVIHVDETIAKIQRTFSFDDTSICDSFMDIAEEIGCLFKFPSNSDENGKIQRTIEVYDLQQNCKDCGNRGEFTDVCPKCGSTNIKYGYGTDTTIFVTADELAASGIQLTTDTDAVKNCFKLEAGDDLMTATIRNCNPNGTDYIWYFSDAMKVDMSEELVNAIEEYDIKYKEVYSGYTIEDGKVIINEGQDKTLVCNTDFNIGDTLMFEYIENDNNESGSASIYSNVIIPIRVNKQRPVYIYENLEYNIYVNEYVRVYKLTNFKGSMLESIYKYNNLVSKYRAVCLDCNNTGYFETSCSYCNSKNIVTRDNIERIDMPIIGYPSLMNAYYNTVDFALFLESGLMPSVEITDTNAKEQAELLTNESLSPVAVSVKDIKNVSKATADSAVLSMAKAIVKSTFKIETIDSSLSEDKTTWTGKFVVTNYSAEEDDVNGTYTTDFISVTINNDEETFIQQKIEKTLKKDDTDNVSISGLFAKDHIDFWNELSKYALKPLSTFYDACEQCLTILQDQGVSTKENWGDDTEGASSNLYEKLYLPYYDKLQAIAEEIKVREDEIAIIKGVYITDEEGNKTLTTKGLQNYIEEHKNKIHKNLNFENFIKSKENIGADLWVEFCAHRREDKYSNDNYISVGLNNAELFDKAREFVDVAEGEIFKSAELQHSISTTLKNLLAIPKFKPLVEHFEVGNWIRVQIDDKIYKLRLLEYSISFEDFDNIPVTFSDVTKIKNGITDVENVLSQASSIAGSYSSVQRQASQGEESKTVLNTWFNDGLDATNTKIVGNAQSQNQVWDKNGILCRDYDSITGQYSPEQLKIINSTIAVTDDNWKTTKTAIGKYTYKDPVTNELRIAYGVNGETIVGRLLIGENLILSNSSGRLMFNDNGLVVSNDINKVTISPDNETSLFNIKKNEDNIFHIDDEGNLVITGDIIASSLTLLDGASVEGNKVSGLADVALTGSYNNLKDKPDLSDVAFSGDYNDLKNKPIILPDGTVSGDYNDLINKPNLAKVATTGDYNDLINKPVKYPKLTSAQKSAIKNLADKYFNNRALFYYNDNALNRNSYANNICYNSDKSKFRLNCSSFAQFIYMGRSIEDFNGKNADTYSNIITTDFDFGYYFEFPNRKVSWCATRDVNGNVTKYFGFKQPHKDEDPDNYTSSYSYNTYYGKDSDRLNQQYFRSYMDANDMAFELYKMGCEIPRSELDIGDIVFTTSAIDVDDKGNAFGDHAFKKITHVLIVYNVDSQGNAAFIDCTSAVNGETAAISRCGYNYDSDYDIARAIHTDENIVFCARHPVAWGKNNMKNVARIDFRLSGCPTGELNSNPIPVNVDSNGNMISTTVIKDKWYIYNNKIGKAIADANATSFGVTYFKDIIN